MLQEQQPVAAIFCGPPGSGKGLLRRQVVNKYLWHGFEMSCVLKNDVVFQAESASYLSDMSRGELLPDTLVTDSLDRYLDNLNVECPGVSIVFDGATRTLHQMYHLLGRLKNYNIHVFVFKVEEAICRERIGARKSEARADDKSKQSVNNRFLKYREHLPAIKVFLSSCGITINNLKAEDKPEEVFRQFCNLTGLAQKGLFAE